MARTRFIRRPTPSRYCVTSGPLPSAPPPLPLLLPALSSPAPEAPASPLTQNSYPVPFTPLFASVSTALLAPLRKPLQISPDPAFLVTIVPSVLPTPVTTSPILFIRALPQAAASHQSNVTQGDLCLMYHMINKQPVDFSLRVLRHMSKISDSEINQSLPYLALISRFLSSHSLIPENYLSEPIPEVSYLNETFVKKSGFRRGRDGTWCRIPEKLSVAIEHILCRNEDSSFENTD